jgi:hypothetical protein
MGEQIEDLKLKDILIKMLDSNDYYCSYRMIVFQGEVIHVPMIIKISNNDKHKKVLENYTDYLIACMSPIVSGLVPKMDELCG